MYNPLKNKIDTFFFNNHVSASYKKIVEIENEEEAYLKKTKLAIVVKNEEVGKRLYDIITSLKKRGVIIETPNAMLRITKYISDKEDRIQVFYINFALKEKVWEEFTEIEKLEEMVSFVNEMKNMGYIIDTSVFDYKKCDQIATLFSYFKPISEEMEEKNECIIEYIHYILSRGKDLNEYFENVDNQGIINTEELSYNMSVTKMFYEYYKTKTYNGEILEVLDDEDYEDDFSCFHYRNHDIESYRTCKYLLLDEEKFKTKVKVLKENDKYSIYENDIKIYKDTLPIEFSELVMNLNDSDFINYVSEKVGNFVCDLDYNIVGYESEEIKSKLFVDKKFNKQSILIEQIQYLYRFFERIVTLSKEHQIQLVENDFDIEKSCVLDSGVILLDNLMDLFECLSSDKSKVQIQITMMFFKLFHKFLKDKNMVMDEEEQFFKIEELKYLSPILVREFINYSLGRPVDFVIASKELEGMFSFGKLKLTAKVSKTGSFYYDTRFIYNPLDVSYLFDYQIEEEYGIKVKQGMKKIEKELDDGGKLVLFSAYKTQNLSYIEGKESGIRNDIWKKFNDFYGSVELSEIKQVIYKKNIINDVYEFIGYITKPIKGKKLTDDFLLSLSNKDFLMVAAELFTKFDTYCIPLEVIYMDENYKFYIDIYDPKYKIEISPGYGDRHAPNETYMYWKINELMKHPRCQINTFINFQSIESIKRKAPARRTLVNTANSLDTYCEEHNVYYDSFEKMCPICLKSKCFVETNQLTDIIFEDKYAKHYKLDSNYNVKIYNKSNVDIAVLEKKVEKMVWWSMNNINRLMQIYHQEAFIPHKKAIGLNNEFVGYIYKAVDFDDKVGDDSCINLNDLENMSNLPRIKALIRLISQVDAIETKGKRFINNPFDNVFLIRGYKKQVQLVNIDFLSTEAGKIQTLTSLYEYVCRIIESDPNINLDLSKHDTIYTILQKLKDLAEKLTKYCSCHNYYYESEYLFCPKCVPDVKSKNYDIEIVDKSTITSLDQINEGGEAFIYDYYESVIKVFKETAININLKNRIMARLINKKEILNEVNKQNEKFGIKFKYIIPEKMFVDRSTNNIFAYSMEKVDGKPLSALRDKAQVEELGFTRRDILEILITAGMGIETLHKKANMYIGDLNGRNILFDKDKNVYFLDLDGMGIDDISPEFCTDGYIDPTSKKNNKITMKDDWYSFAVQAFYYLTYTHPFNGIYYTVKNGEKVALEIPEKMEQKISLLGNHNMKPPSVAIPWDDWMNIKLKKEFLSIFEESNRNSIVLLLKEQYNELYGSYYKMEEPLDDQNEQENSPDMQQEQEKPLDYQEEPKEEINEEVIRINSKFIATKLPVFNDEVLNEVIKVVNPYCAICKDKAEKHFLLGANGRFLVYSGIFEFYENIVDIIISDDEKLAFVVLGKSIKVLNIQDSTFVCTKNISDPNNVVVNGSTLYYNLDNIIYELTFDSCQLVKEKKIEFLTEYEIKRFYVQSNSKFVQVKRNSTEKVDGIYCNSELLCNIIYNSEDTNYNIIYDEISKLWLVINSEGNVISINSKNGSYEQVQIQNIDEYNIENITFHNGRMYIPDVGNLYIVNVNNKFTIKKMECHSIMTPDSKVCSVHSNGFNVLANNNIYEVSRG